MPKILVTGADGFIGSHLCERLLHLGHAVWAFDDLNPFYDPQLKRRNIGEIQSLAKPFEFVHGDVTDRAALNNLFEGVRFDQVIHLAARAGVNLDQRILSPLTGGASSINVMVPSLKDAAPVDERLSKLPEVTRVTTLSRPLALLVLARSARMGPRCGLCWLAAARREFAF